MFVFLGEPTKGSGQEYTGQINQTIEKYNLTDRVFIRPFRQDIEVFYAAIDLLSWHPKPKRLEW